MREGIAEEEDLIKGRSAGWSGHCYCRARVYAPHLGRFVSRDPIGYEGGINPYAYVGDRPVKECDANGTDRTLPKGLFSRRPHLDGSSLGTHIFWVHGCIWLSKAYDDCWIRIKGGCDGVVRFYLGVD